MRGAKILFEFDIHKSFRDQLATKTQRQIARDLGVVQSVVSRNASRLRRGMPITKSFAIQIEAALK